MWTRAVIAGLCFGMIGCTSSPTEPTSAVNSPNYDWDALPAAKSPEDDWDSAVLIASTYVEGSTDRAARIINSYARGSISKPDAVAALGDEIVIARSANRLIAETPASPQSLEEKAVFQKALTQLVVAVEASKDCVQTDSQRSCNDALDAIATAQQRLIDFDRLLKSAPTRPPSSMGSGTGCASSCAINQEEMVDPDEIGMRNFVVTVENARVANKTPGFDIILDSSSEVSGNAVIENLGVGYNQSATISIRVPLSQTRFNLTLKFTLDDGSFAPSRQTARPPPASVRTTGFAFNTSTHDSLHVLVYDDLSALEPLQFHFNCSTCDDAEASRPDTSTVTTNVTLDILNWRRSGESFNLFNPKIVADYHNRSVEMSMTRSGHSGSLWVGYPAKMTMSTSWPAASPPSGLRVVFDSQAGSAFSTLSFPIARSNSSTTRLVVQDGYERPDGIEIRGTCEPCPASFPFTAPDAINWNATKISFTILNHYDSQTSFECSLMGWANGEHRLFWVYVTTRRDEKVELVPTPTSHNLTDARIRCPAYGVEWAIHQMTETAAIRFDIGPAGSGVQATCTFGCELRRL